LDILGLSCWAFPSPACPKKIQPCNSLLWLTFRRYFQLVSRGLAVCVRVVPHFGLETNGFQGSFRQFPGVRGTHFRPFSVDVRGPGSWAGDTNMYPKLLPQTRYFEGKALQHLFRMVFRLVLNSAPHRASDALYSFLVFQHLFVGGGGDLGPLPGPT
jgi:hypothetical protein